MGSISHVPVLLAECLTLLGEAGHCAATRRFVDATFGAGGHTRALLDAIPNCQVLALDADPAAVAAAQRMAHAYPQRLLVAHANFADLDAALDASGFGNVDGVLYDLGLSSLQLADASRGFSFAGNQLLDMRLDPSADVPTASDLLRTLPQSELESVLREYGDERRARSIARSILRRRPRTPTWRGSDLVAAVLAALPAGTPHARIHPVTRTFQALRIAVNSEYRNLERSLEIAVRRLRVSGRLLAISFHSGEDRIVKRRFRAFAQAGLAAILTRRPLRPGVAEIKSNPRSRSARLRAVARQADLALGRAA